MKLTPAGQKLVKAVTALFAISVFSCAGFGIWSYSGSSDETASDNSGSSGGFKMPSFSSAKTCKGPLGSSPECAINIGLVSFHGYAPFLLALGGLETQPGSIAAQNGLYAKVHIKDDIPTLYEQFEDPSTPMHCSWRTSDFWAQEQPGLRKSGGDGKGILIVDNTQGADAIIARDPSIQRIEDLVGKKIGLIEGTPSHGLIIYAVNNSSLPKSKKRAILDNLVKINGGLSDVQSAFEGGSIDAAVMWDPELHLALKGVPGSHVVYSTKEASSLIYDVLVCNTEVIDNGAHEGAMTALVVSWMKGVEMAKANPDAAADILIANEEMFSVLAEREGKPFVRSLFSELVWTGLEDNLRILGRGTGGTNQYERVYAEFRDIYREAGLVGDMSAAPIHPSESFDYRFIDHMAEHDTSAKAKAAKPEFSFSDAAREQAIAKAPIMVKPVLISFQTGSAELNKRSEETIDNEMKPLIESNGSAYFTISGNTDSTGSRAGNIALSKRRAQTVVDYLVTEWEFDRSRFEVRGNGPDEPLCNESDPESYEPGTTLEDCRQVNRTVRIGVQGRG